MVRTLFLVILFICTAMPYAAISAELIATVSRNPVVAGEEFTLTLELKDASTRTEPDISPVQDAFDIAGTGRSSSTEIINGRMSQSISWHYTLIARTTGEFTIPPLSLKVAGSTLNTQPIRMRVHDAASLPAITEDASIRIEADISDTQPYVGQTTIYTVRIIRTRPLIDSKLEPPSSDEAIIDATDEQKNYTQVVNGNRVSVTEIQYLITPIKAGTVHIAPTILKGRMQEKIAPSSRRNPFGMSSDPFDIFQQFSVFNSQQNFQPFTLASNSLQLSVQPPAAKIEPWLPLTSLEITDSWAEGQMLKAGEPFTRTLTIVAHGMAGSQLPSVEKTIAADGFKIYKEKEDTGQEFSAQDNILTGWRSETYTIIPQRGGTMILPEIKIPWWNIQTGRLEYAILPERSVSVKSSGIWPPRDPALKNITEKEPEKSAVPPSHHVKEPLLEEGKTHTPQPLFFYFLTAVSVLFGTLLLFFLAALRKKRSATTPASAPHNENTPDTPPKKAAKENAALSLRQIRPIHDIHTLESFLQKYAHLHWQTPKNAALRIIAEHLAMHTEPDKETAIRDLFDTLDKALYAGGSMDIAAWKERFSVLARSTQPKKKQKEHHEDTLTPLNPS